MREKNKKWHCRWGPPRRLNSEYNNYCLDLFIKCRSCWAVASCTYNIASFTSFKLLEHLIQSLKFHFRKVSLKCKNVQEANRSAGNSFRAIVDLYQSAMISNYTNKAHSFPWRKRVIHMKISKTDYWAWPRRVRCRCETTKFKIW